MVQEQPRHTDGKFASKAQSEAAVVLSDETRSDMTAASTCTDTNELWRHVRSDSRDIRLAAALNSNITGEQLTALTQDPDPVVRMEVADLPYPGVAERMANDPDPLVRAIAFREGWDLSDATFDRLAGDDDVLSADHHLSS